MDIPCSDGKRQISSTAKTCLNALSGKKVIGLSESIHSCLNLPLTLCSEKMCEVRIGGWSKLKYTTNVLPKSDILTKYYLRNTNYHMSLWQFFHHNNNKKNGGNILSIPYAVGINSKPSSPPTPEYARSSLIKHYPWSKAKPLNLRNNEEVIDNFITFVNKNTCPRLLKIEYRRCMIQKKNKSVYFEPTNSRMQISEMSLEKDS